VKLRWAIAMLLVGLALSVVGACFVRVEWHGPSWAQYTWGAGLGLFWSGVIEAVRWGERRRR
jgi:hypothetical protein